MIYEKLYKNAAEDLSFYHGSWKISMYLDIHFDNECNNFSIEEYG